MPVMPRRRGPGRYISRSPTSSSSTGGNGRQRNATYMYGGLLLLLLALSASLQLRHSGPAEEKSSVSGLDSGNTATKATASLSVDAQESNKCKRKRARNDYSPSSSERQETLIHLLGQMIRLYQTRLENDLPLVDEKRKDLAWGNGVWDISENRSHFRSHYPLLTAQSIWDNAADHFYQVGGVGWAIPSSYPISEAATIQNGDVIFINQVWVNWINDVAPLVEATANVTVVLFDGDISFCSGPQQDTLRNLDFVSRIFVPNACPHPKVTQLPLGLMDNLEFPTASESWTIHGKELKVANILMNGALYENKNGIYCDMNIQNNPHERSEALRACQDLNRTASCDEYRVSIGSLATEKVHRPWEEYIKDLSQHRFVVSPQGNGFDCHRTWESLLAGSIPIVKHVEGMAAVFDGLPVLVVDSWTDLDEDLLENYWNEFVDKKGSWKFEKLFAPYWVDQIRQTKSHSSAFNQYGDPGGIGS